MIRCGSSNAVLVASPSANVLVVSSTRVRRLPRTVRGPGAAWDCTPITSTDERTALAATAGPRRPAAAADRDTTTITSISGWAWPFGENVQKSAR